MIQQFQHWFSSIQSRIHHLKGQLEQLIDEGKSIQEKRIIKQTNSQPKDDLVKRCFHQLNLAHVSDLEKIKQKTKSLQDKIDALIAKQDELKNAKRPTKRTSTKKPKSKATAS